MTKTRLIVAALTCVAAMTASTAAAAIWVDVTEGTVANPSFNSNSAASWTIEGTATTKSASSGCMQLGGGTFNLHQTLADLPAGRYRLWAQAFYRMADNSTAHSRHNSGQETLSARLYAGQASVAVASVYSFSFSTNVDNACWSANSWGWWAQPPFYPNTVGTAAKAFAQGAYDNCIEFDAEGDVVIGVRNDTQASANWCCIDNFRLERLTETVPPTEGSVVVNEVMAGNIDQFVSPSVNFDGWAELYNTTDHVIELAGLWLSDDEAVPMKWRMPQDMPYLPAHGHAVVWFDNNPLCATNAPFKLDTDGGTLVVSTADGHVLTAQDYPPSVRRTSYARTTDGGPDWRLTHTPTPGATNDASLWADVQLPPPTVDQPDQLFTGTLTVHVDIPQGATLRYTTNGSLPTLTTGQTSTTGTFTLTATRCYRFRLFAEGMLPSDAVTRSYIKRDKNYTGPVISVVADDAFLYGDELGVMTRGTNGKPGNGQSTPCNWNMDWDRPANFAFIDADGRAALNQDVYLSMCGGWSRAWEPHSFKLKGNKRLTGSKTLDYPFFKAKPYIRNRTLQIRNGGNDNTCRIKDPALETIIQTSGIDCDLQSYQPVHEFVNGKYIGVLNMREPNNKHFVFANWGWDDDEIDQFEMSADSGYVQKCGTREAFSRLVELSAQAADADTYEEIKRRLDIDEYVNYMALMLWLGSNDWPHNNLKAYAPRPEGRFRFVSFDLDFAFNRGSNTFTEFAKEQTYTFAYLYDLQKSLTQQIESVTLFLNMLGNDDFRRRFIDTYCVVGGSIFQSTRAAHIIDSLTATARPMMQLKNESPSNTANQMKQSLASRTATMATALRNYAPMRLQGTAQQTVSLSVGHPAARIFVNDTEVYTGAFDGRLFAPVTLRAEAPAGHTFVAWVNPQDGTTLSRDQRWVMPAGTVRARAVFAPDDDRPAASVRINEVCAQGDIFVNDHYKKADWLELYNPTADTIDVEGMCLSDDAARPMRYVLTSGDSQASTLIAPRGHLLVWCDKRQPVTQLHSGFKLSKDGGTLVLTHADGRTADTFSYPAHQSPLSVGRYPDAADSIYVMSLPTIGRRNQMTSYARFHADSRQPSAIDVVALASVAEPLTVACHAGAVVVRGADGEAVCLTVTSLSGQTVVRRRLVLHGGMAELPTSSLPRGTYVAHVAPVAPAPAPRAARCKFVNNSPAPLR